MSLEITVASIFFVFAFLGFGAYFVNKHLRSREHPSLREHQEMGLSEMNRTGSVNKALVIVFFIFFASVAKNLRQTPIIRWCEKHGNCFYFLQL